MGNGRRLSLPPSKIPTGLHCVALLIDCLSDYRSNDLFLAVLLLRITGNAPLALLLLHIAPALYGRQCWLTAALRLAESAASFQ